MRAARSLLSLKSTARKLGFLVVELASFEQGCSGYLRPWGGTRTVPGGRCQAAGPARQRTPPCEAGGAWAGGPALAAWGKKIEFVLVDGSGFG